MNPVEQVFPPPEELSGHVDSPPPERQQMLDLIHENGRLRADLLLARQRIRALESRIVRINSDTNHEVLGISWPSDD